MTEDLAFDTALVTAAFAIAGEIGWPRMSVAEAARRAGLPLDQARGRLPSQAAILMRFGRLADQAALAGADSNPDSPHRDRLFDILMRRIDVLQLHREGVLALLRALPLNAPLALALAADTTRSMAWMLEGAGIDSTGPRGALRANSLFGIWLWTVRAWRDDESEDLSATMATLDKALDCAVQAEGWIGARGSAAMPDAEMEPMADEPPEVIVAALPRTSPPPPDVPDSPAI